jgi:sulfide:quinone oxidoreductase
MPEVRSLAPGFAVTGQLRVEDLADITARGFRSIVNNRPDGEEPGQPRAADIAAEARRLGLVWRDLPMATREVSDEQARDFEHMLPRLPAPVLAFCRTGARSTALWERAQAGRGEPAAGAS